MKTFLLTTLRKGLRGHGWVCVAGLAMIGLAAAACGSASAADSLPTGMAPAATQSLSIAAEPTTPTADTTPLASAPTGTPAPTGAVTASATPTAQAILEPTLGYYNITPAADATLVTPIPTPVSQAPLDQTLVNVLLVGTDYRANQGSVRTDTLIIVSINKESGVVTMLSIPRDLFVYIPTWGMSRINRAYADGQASNYAGGGPGLLEQTILYNLGIPIHYYALVNFDGFRQIVDTVGGMDVPVNCQLTEYRIKDPTLDESLPANYDLYTQPIGVTHMDGALALWYARARPVGGDFFRGYRQRQVLRALFHKALNADVIPQIPDLYGNFKGVIQTDMSVWDVMQFVPLATKLDDAQIRSLHIGPNQTTAWYTPKGEEVLLPRPGAMQALIGEAFTAPSNNQLGRPVTRVEIWNTTPNVDWDRLAAETLANEGFAPVIGQPDGGPYATTTLIDFTTSPKGSPLKRLQASLHVDDKNVVAQPDPNSPAPFRVILGSDYNACPRLDWMDDSGDATPTPAPASADTPAPTPTP